MKYYFCGLVRLKISGRYPERFLNLCMQQRISVLQIERHDAHLFVWLKVKDFFLLPPLVRKAKVRVRIVRRYGLPFLWRRWRRRRVLLGGLVLFFIALYYLSLRIWLIEVDTANALLREAVADSLTKANIKVGMKQSALDREDLTRRLIADHSSIAWVGIENTGTKLIIRVVEKELPDLNDHANEAVTAAKSGEIVKVVPLEGVQLVETGDFVEKGDTLIAADSDGRSGGIVLARVIYEETVSVPLLDYSYSRTGHRAYGISIFFLDRLLMQYDQSHKYLYTEREEYRKKLLDWRNQEPFVELIIDIYYELALHYAKLTLAEAKEQALRDAEIQLSGNLPQDACICEQSIVLESFENDVYSVTLRAVTEENIAVGGN